MSTAWSDAAVMMTLSAITYQNDIQWQLSQTGYATGGQWSLVWGPASDDLGNFIYVARSAAGAYAVAVRGSELSESWTAIENWLFDFDVLVQDEWPYFGNSGDDAVSNGAYVQTMGLTRITYAGLTLLAFLKATLTSSTTLYVTGHSLGGNLATVLASWLSSQLGPAPGQPDNNTQVYAFATPSPGNASFVASYNDRFPKSWRYVNSLDVAPHAWNNLLAVNTIYDANFLYTPLVIQIAVGTLRGNLDIAQFVLDSYYDQTNGFGSVLNGAFEIAMDWYSEVANQHWSNTYLSLLGALPVTAPSGVVFVTANVAIPVMPPPVLKRPKTRAKW